MDTTPIGEELIRKYLLGLLPEAEWDEIEQKLLTDEDFARTVEVVEDEIVDDYLDGTLSEADRRAAENHFFRAPEHQLKGRFAGLLRSHLRGGKPSEAPRFVPPFVPRRLFWAASAAFAALLLVSAGLGVYTLRLQRKLDAEIAKNGSDQRILQADLEKERSQTAQLLEQLRLAKDGQNASPASMVLSLLPLDRSQGSIPELKRVAEPKWLEIHIPLIDFVAASYKASLRDANGRELWSSANVKPQSGILVLKVPVRLVSSGTYSIVVDGENASHTYPFKVS